MGSGKLYTITVTRTTPLRGPWLRSSRTSPKAGSVCEVARARLQLLHLVSCLSVAPNIQAIGRGNLEAPRAQDRHDVAAVVVRMVNRLRHGHCSGHTPAVSGGDLASWEVVVLGQDLPAAAEASDALGELIQRRRPVR